MKKRRKLMIFCAAALTVWWILVFVFGAVEASSANIVGGADMPSLMLRVGEYLRTVPGLILYVLSAAFIVWLAAELIFGFVRRRSVKK